MVTQRTEGLYLVFLFCQIVIVAALFWIGVWIMVTFYSPGGALTWGRYSIYCGMLVLGLTLETLSRSKNFFMQNELLRPHRLSLRQTAASVGLLVLYLVCRLLLEKKKINTTRRTRHLNVREPPHD